MSISRKRRGMRTQKLVAEYLREIWPFADTAGAGRSGQDILNTPGFAGEVKAQSRVNLGAWLRQAAVNAGEDEIPYVVFRINGQGEASIDDWLVAMYAIHLYRVFGLAFLVGKYLIECLGTTIQRQAYHDDKVICPHHDDGRCPVEVTTRNRMDLRAWVKKAAKHTGPNYPMLVVMPNGQEKFRTLYWPVLMRLADWRELVKDAVLRKDE